MGKLGFVAEHNTPATRFTVQNNKLVTGYRGRIDVRDLHNHKIYNSKSLADKLPYKFAVQGNHFCCAVYTAVESKKSEDAEHAIFVWDLNDQEEKPKHILRGHQNLITSVIIQENEVVSVSKDSVRIWDLRSGEELKVWEKDEILAYAVQGDKHFIAMDTTIKVYDKENGEELYTLNGDHRIYKLIIQGTTLVSIEINAEDGNYICKVWDLKSKEVCHILRNISDPGSRPRVAIIDNVLFVVGREETGEIKTWNLKTGKQFPSLLIPREHDELRDIQSHEGKLYFRRDAGLQVYDFNLAPLSRQALEDNLATIKKLENSDLFLGTSNLSARKELSYELDPRIQDRVIWGQREFLSHMQTELIVELLLDCIRSGDQQRISDVLMKLMLRGDHTKLYEHLWVACGKPKLPEKSYGRPAKEIWAELAFLSDGGGATVDQKEQALIMFKSKLLEGRY